MRSDTLKQPAMSRHPIGTASFFLRVATPGGSLWQACMTEPKPIAEAIAWMEEQIAIMRKMLVVAQTAAPEPAQ